jgi:hypothetical protein
VTNFHEEAKYDFTHLETIFFSAIRYSRLKTTEELVLQDNQLTGTISQELCNQRGLSFGELKILTVDCVVQCSCCTKWTDCRRRVLF